jgi:hypothetical protein
VGHLGGDRLDGRGDGVGVLGHHLAVVGGDGGEDGDAGVGGEDGVEVRAHRADLLLGGPMCLPVALMNATGHWMRV